MRTKNLALAAVALAAGLSLTACQGNGDSAASTNDSSSSSAGTSAGSGASDENGSATGDGSTTGDGSATSDGSTTAKSAQGGGDEQITTGACKTANLDFSASHGMAEGVLLVSLKNTGGDACSLKGFPGVDLKSQDASGALSANRSELAAPAVTVKPGEATRFTLHYPPNNTGGTGVRVTALTVTPPNETHSKDLSVSINIPVAEGADEKVVVDPVGTGKQ